MPPESPRIAELRRRVHADPASIAFAQLAEEYRRSGNYEEAIAYCRTGLARHPGYLSARVTLGRALSEIGGLDEAAHEFALVLKSAPDNLAAIRGLAEIYQRRGDMASALDYYRRALALARFDPELEETVTRIGREMGLVIATPPGAASSFDEAMSDASGGATEDSEAASSVPITDPADGELSPGAPGRPKGSDLIDFDALLASLGVPDASPPPMMQMLISAPSALVTPPPVTSPPPVVAPVEEAFADLERELRAFYATPVEPSAESAVAEVVEQLEAWVRVLQKERSGGSPTIDHTTSA